jgi:hypothetical protein
MRPAIGGTYQLGGSPTPQEALKQFFVGAALRAGGSADTGPPATSRRPADDSAERFVRWREAASQAVVAVTGAVVPPARLPVDCAVRWLRLSSRLRPTHVSGATPDP